MSSICPARTRSSGGILYLRLRQNAFANSAIQILERNEVGATTDQRGELLLNVGDVPTRFMAGLKFVKNINVAVGSEVIAKDRSKEREPADMVALAEGSEALAVN